MGKSFTTAVREDEAERQDLEYPYDFDLDGKTVRFRKMASGESMMLSIAMLPHRPMVEKVAAVVDLFARVLDPATKQWVLERLMDPEDDLGPAELFGEDGKGGILGYMLEEWSARPTDR